MPFEAAQICLARFWSMLLQQLQSAAQVAVFHRLVPEVDVGDVFVEARGRLALFGLHTQTRLLALGSYRLTFSARRANRLPKAQARPKQKRSGNCGCRHE